MFFVQAMQRLQTDAAMKMAGKVAPFYWVDAPRVLVWLCRECAAELHISEAPRAVLQGVRDVSVSSSRPLPLGEGWVRV